ncbi:AbiH family protein [Pedobacter sp. Hv1]|uniref:AbiH family protein n=1 Tax=Pedobacter sp. Hv1 TaxID=1740090 RepID=UPI0009E667AF|nr:AbiH family protein [Pedobacter sp. Hv1]
MNRLILIGNGFDLAHGMKTSYNDFILWYLTNCFSKSGDGYEDDLLIIQANSYVYVHQELAGKTIPEYIKEHYENGTLNSLMQIKHDYVSDFITSSDHYRSRQPEWTSAFKVQIKSELLTQMINNCAIDKWVDIENLFYSSLKKALTVENQNKDRDVKDLNKSIAFIIEELRVYLANLGHCKERIDEYRILMKEAIRPSEIVERPPLTPDDLLGTVPNNTLILNFNYTDTVEQYLSDDSNVKVNYIHGKLNENENPMIFGFGDELDAEYSKFELDRTKELFKYIKSFWYFKTSNYHDLLRFIQGETFQVYILGHSCGLSDRTMLNMIFEHENCVSIKIYYYENPQEISKNNYTELTEEISRHFKDKRQMRLKIVPFDKSSCMPQISPF